MLVTWNSKSNYVTIKKITWNNLLVGYTQVSVLPPLLEWYSEGLLIGRANPIEWYGEGAVPPNEKHFWQKRQL